MMVAAVVGVLLCSCATQPKGISTPEHNGQTSTTPTPQTESGEPRNDESGRLILMPDDSAPVAPDLKRLAKMFARYAVGDSDTFTHRESVSMSLGGQPIESIDDISAALSNRKVWKVCPADWELYGASSCPVNFLGPLTDAIVNRTSLVYSADPNDVVCAPTRTGPLPPERIVIIRPRKDESTCAYDFALVLAADDHGRLRHIDLTLSEP